MTALRRAVRRQARAKTARREEVEHERGEKYV
jgi:hypothetical protein